MNNFAPKKCLWFQNEVPRFKGHLCEITTEKTKLPCAQHQNFPKIIHRH